MQQQDKMCWAQEEAVEDRAEEGEEEGAQEGVVTHRQEGKRHG